MKPTLINLKAAANKLASLKDTANFYSTVKKLQQAIGEWRADGEEKEYHLFTTDPHGAQEFLYLSPAADGKPQQCIENTLFTIKGKDDGSRITMTGLEVDSLVHQWLAHKRGDKRIYPTTTR